jgi:hypothetical protein
MNGTISLSVSLIFGLTIALIVGGAVVAILLWTAQSLPLRKPLQSSSGHDRTPTL